MVLPSVSAAAEEPNSTSPVVDVLNHRLTDSFWPPVTSPDGIAIEEDVPLNDAAVESENRPGAPRVTPE